MLKRTPKMLIRVCDKCRAELTESAPMLSVRYRETPTSETIVRLFDFCLACVAGIMEPYGTGRAPQIHTTTHGGKRS